MNANKLKLTENSVAEFRPRRFAAAHRVVRTASPCERPVARLRQAARLARTASPREPNVRPDFLPRQSGVTRPLPGQKVGQLGVGRPKLVRRDR